MGKSLRYQVIYADPPWKFKTWSAKGTGRSAVSHYKVMPLPAIIKYMQDKLERYAADDCAVCMWCPGEMLHWGMQIFAACGVEYIKPMFVWAKTTKHGKWHFSTGYYTRNNPEFMLFGRIGKPKCRSRSVRQLQIFPLRQHSQKPDEFRDLIEQLFAGPYLELFARQTKLFWHSIGDQVGLLDEGPVKTRRQPSNLRAHHETTRPLQAANKQKLHRVRTR